MATACETWRDHEWSAPRFLETGRHPTMGSFNRYTVECTRCGHRTTETHWITLSTVSGGYGFDLSETKAPDR